MNIITLLNAAKALNQISETKISSRLAYKIMKFYKSVEIEEEFYNKKRMEIVEMYAQKDDNGQPVVDNNGIIQIIENKIVDANLAMMELNNTEVSIPDIKFALSELEELKLSVKDMYALDAFIEEE